MKKMIFAVLAALVMILTASALRAQERSGKTPPPAPPPVDTTLVPERHDHDDSDRHGKPPEEHHIKADLVSIDGSGVTGTVELSQQHHGNTGIHAIVTGLQRGTTYALFHSESGDCSTQGRLIARFTAKKNGAGEVEDEIEVDLGEIRSITVRIARGRSQSGTLLACASVRPDVTAPTVSSTVPLNGATGVPVNKVLSAVFSEAMDPRTINTSSFTLKQGTTKHDEITSHEPTVVDGTVSYTGVTATFTPTDALDPNATYTATISTKATDLAGNALAHKVVWSFTTGSATVVTPPTVSATVPANAATGVAISGKLAVTFSEAMDPLTIGTASFTLKQGATVVAGTVSYTGVTAIFTPTGNLAPNAVYTATITTAATNVAGTALATDFVWSFTTGATPDITAPTVSSTVPVNTATGVPISGKLTATFSEPMDPLTITTTSFTLKHGTTGVAGVTSYAGVTATFTPAGNLAPLTAYTATISTVARDLAGNALVTDYSWTFTTGSTPDVTAPSVSSTVPVNAATGVAISGKLTATFSEAMDPLTISTASFTLRHGSIGVAGVVTYSGVTATFTPAGNLTPLTVYTATMSSAATDLAGNALVTSFSWTFTTGSTPDVIAPTVSSTVPFNAATFVPLGGKLAATFSEAMDPLTISTASFTLKQGATLVAGTVSYAGVTATFTPTVNLAPNALYTATITTAATDLAGNALATNFSWTFTTGSVPDVTAPTVSSTVPVNAATGVAISGKLTATFSEAMDPLTISTTSFTLHQGVTPVAGTVVYAGVTGTFTPTATLAPNALYTATITTTATDLAGNPLVTDFVWNFTTGSAPDITAPTVSSTVPINAATGVAISAKLAATFSEAMDPLTISTASFTLKQGVTPVAGTVGYAGVTATFTPAANLAASTVYSATITTAATDLAGNALVTNFSWSFTTGTAPDVTAPTVSSTVPVNAATGVVVSGKLTATFSEAMDPLSISTASFTLKQGVNPVVGTVSYAGVTATFTPAADLAANSLYTATITTAARDLAGNALAANFVWSFTTAGTAAGQAPVALGSAATFAVLGGSTVTNVGASIVNGDLGLSPGTAITGFPPGVVNGTTHAADLVAAQAQLDLTAAYNDAAGRTTGAIPVAGDLGGQTLTPGLYKSTSTLDITSGDLTLDAQGDANAVFIFQLGSALTTTVGRQVILTGGAKAANIFWQVGSSATLGTNSVFKGNILALASITATTGAAVEGRLLARTAAVTLGTNVVGLGTTADITPPTVSAVVPLNAATGVPISGKQAITFSEAMDPLTITTTSFTLKQGVNAVAGAVTYAGVTATFTPTANLAPLTVYTATITTGAKDVAGNALATNFVWSFTTGSTPDVTAPTVSAVVPLNAATGVAISGKLTAAFSEAMDPLTITTTSFTLKQGVTAVAGTVGYAGVTATFTPTANLAPLTVYTATITTGAKDLAGNALVTNFSWSFTTGSAPDITPPTVSSTVPTGGATGVGINQAVNATFSEAMDPLTITTASFTLKQGVNPVVGTVGYDVVGKIATFTPTANLAALTAYTATITTGAKDLAGNALATNFVWSFTTAGTAAGQAPVVLGSATTFAVLGGSTITNTGLSIINGDMGLSPGTAVTGFPPGVVNGATHTADAVAAQAQLDLTAAYNDAAGRTTGAIPVAGDLGGQTLTPGLYKSTSTLDITSADLTLDAQGDANAVFIFQLGSALTTTVGRQVILTGGAKAANVFWQVGSSATLGINSVFKGNILALASITAAGGAAVEGRLLARNAAITLNANVVGVGAIVDITPPTVSAVVPLNAATGVPITGKPTATFSEAMDPLTITTASFTLKQGVNAVAGTVTYAGVTATFTPTANLAALTAYTATITTGAKDLAGNALATNFVWSFTTAGAAAGQAPVALGSVSTFAVLGGSTITNTGLSIINGDMGLSPGTAVTGFPPGTVNGATHTADAVAAQAQLDLTAAYNDAAGRTTGAIPVAGDLGGQTLTPGLYKSTSTLDITSADLTLDAQGDANAVFIFQLGSALTTTVGRQVILTGGAKAANIFWQVGSSATLGSNSVFKGNILALASITAAGGAAVEGRLLARTAAITLNANVVGLGAGADITPPTVSAVVPLNAATGVPISGKLAITFSEAMDPLTITTTNFTLKQGVTPVAGTVTYAGVTATFTPTANLAPLTVYTGAINMTAKDVAGNALATSFVWSFTTGSTPDVTAPTVIATVPVNAATGVAISGKLTAAFSEAMDPLTITTTSFTLKQGVTAVAGTVGYAGVTATFTPGASLAPLTVYTATITTGAKDLAGNALVTNFSWSFTTGSAPDITPPTVSSTVPTGGATGVGINQAVNATFSEAMDPLTITTASFTLKQGVTAVAGTVSYAGVTATFTPTANLVALTVYTATITTAAKDLAGNALATNFVWSFTTAGTAAGQAPVVLGSASTFAVLGGSTIANTGLSTVNGDLGLSPGTAVTGFPPGVVNGTTHTADAVAAQAQLDLTAAYNDAAGRTTGAIPVAGDLGGQTLAPGLYKSTSTLDITSGDLTLDAQGDANAVFIFQLGSALTTTVGRQVILTGGAKAANVFWQVGSSATLGINSVFKGNILALASITAAGGAAVEGRLLARTAAITLNANVVGVAVPADITPPTVSAVVPLNAATGVPISGNVAATFSEAMDPLTISTASFTLKRGVTPVAGTVSYVGVTATFTPTANLVPLTVYTATVTTGAKDLAGNALTASFVWSFTTGSTPDVTAPTVIATVPVNAATGVAISGKLTAAFSEAMDPLTISTASFTLKQGVTAVAATVSYAGVTATFTPGANLAPLTVYTATITTGAKDLAGNALVTNFSWSFTTGSAPDITPPTVSSTVPTGGATGVGINQAVNATFSEAMDPLTITTASMTLTGPGGTGVIGTVGYDVVGKIATFTPTASLAALTVYTATVTTAAKDLAGNALATNFVWSFTTAGTAAGQAPVVLGSASTFAVLGGSTIANTGLSTVNGDLGLSPGTAVTGFPPGVVNGATHAADAVAAQAQLDLTAAYNDAAGRTTGAIPVAGDLGGQTLTPGLYKSTSTLDITAADLTLDAQGDANAVFIFQLGSALTTTVGRQVILTGGAKAANVFWQVGSSATLGTNTVFKGNILALASITVTSGAVVDGRLLARTAAVTLNACAVGLGSVAPAALVASAQTGTTDAVVGVPNRVSLSSSNPLRSGPATIRFGLAKADRVEINVYDVGGRVVSRVVNQAFEAGEHEVVWNRLDRSGLPVPRGLYFTQVTYSSQRFAVTKKLIIVE